MKGSFKNYPHDSMNHFNACMKLFLAMGLLLVGFAGCAHRSAVPLKPFPAEYYENHIIFNKASSKTYPKTTIQNLRIYKSINHFLGQQDIIRRDETPLVPYEVIGTLFFKEDWYFESTLEYLIKKKVEEAGGDAILEYEMFQTQTATIKRQDNGKIESLYFMKIQATVIKYND